MIKSFADRRTAALFAGLPIKGTPADLANRARKKLMQVEHARQLTDVALPPGNRLEALSGDRSGSYSIRVNDQWRLCFRWHEGNAFEVEFCDYH